MVPTWNYVAIHAYGPLSFHDEPHRLLAHLKQLTDKHEAGRTAPWAVSDAPADFIAAQIKGIISFEMPIVRLEGKWKLNQNRDDADRAGVIDGLKQCGGADEAAMAKIMTARMKE